MPDKNKKLLLDLEYPITVPIIFLYLYVILKASNYGLFSIIKK